jgi:hypothetical protein
MGYQPTGREIDLTCTPPIWDVVIPPPAAAGALWSSYTVTVGEPAPPANCTGCGAPPQGRRACDYCGRVRS